VAACAAIATGLQVIRGVILEVSGGRDWLLQTGQGPPQTAEIPSQGSIALKKLLKINLTGGDNAGQQALQHAIGQARGLQGGVGWG